MLRHGFIASLLLIGSFVLLTTLTSIKTMAERPTFASDIRPILQSSCQPCHFQGGKMYEKLPFDKPQTIWQNYESRAATSTAGNRNVSRTSAAPDVRVQKTARTTASAIKAAGA